MQKFDHMLVTNISTPYRVSMWNRLTELRPDLSFCVLFMSESEPNRRWVIEDDFKFASEVWKMPARVVRGYYARLSVSYVRFAVARSRHLILGGSWNDLNVILICLLKRLGIIKNKISFWTEANTLTLGARKRGVFKRIFRRWILNTADGCYFIPGEMAEQALREWGVESDGRTRRLPNTPHRNFDANFGIWKGSGEELPVVCVVARLDESTKGILNFLRLLGRDRLQKVSLFIFGSGPDESEYASYLRDAGASNVHLMGEQSSADIIKFLKTSDVFLLPSISDPSPLALVEAIKIGLPIIVSDRCGNHFECLESGVNGFLFNPESRASVWAAFDRMLASKPRWSDFSRHSLRLACKNFDTEQVVLNFAKDLDAALLR